MNNYESLPNQKLNKLIKDIYIDLENIKFKDDIYDSNCDDSNFEYHIFETSSALNGYGHRYKFPNNCDIICLLYNKGNYDIKIEIFCYDKIICTQILKSKEYLYPLHNLCIFPSYLFDNKKILSMRLEYNEDITNITIIGMSLSKKEKKLFDSTYFYCILKKNGKCDLIYNNHYEFDREFLDDWIILSRFYPIVIKI